MPTTEEKRKKRLVPQARAEPLRLPAATNASVADMVGRENARIGQQMGEAQIAPEVRARNQAQRTATAGAARRESDQALRQREQEYAARGVQIREQNIASNPARLKREQERQARGQPGVIPRERAQRQGQAEGAAVVGGGTYYAVGTRDLGREAASSLVGLMSNSATREGALKQWDAMSPEDQAKYPVMAQQAQVYRQTHEQELAEQKEADALAERERQREQVEEGREDVVFEQRQADRERGLAEGAEDRADELADEQREEAYTEQKRGQEQADYLSREDKEARQKAEKQFASRKEVLELVEEQATGKLDDLEDEAKKLQTQRASYTYDLLPEDEARLAELMGPEGLIVKQREVAETTQRKLATHLGGAIILLEQRLDAGESWDAMVESGELGALTDEELLYLEQYAQGRQ